MPNILLVDDERENVSSLSRYPVPTRSRLAIAGGVQRRRRHGDFEIDAD